MKKNIKCDLKKKKKKLVYLYSYLYFERVHMPYSKRRIYGDAALNFLASCISEFYFFFFWGYGFIFTGPNVVAESLFLAATEQKSGKRSRDV